MNKSESFAFKSPSNVMISGCTQAGKSQFLYYLLIHRKRLFENCSNKVLFYYSVWQKIYTDLERNFDGKIFFSQTFKKEDIEPLYNSFVIFDDFLTKFSSEYLDIFLVGSHQKNLTCVFLTQALFFNDIVKTIRRNTHYFVYLGNLDKMSVFRNMQSDLDKYSLEKFKEAFSAIMSVQYAHIVYDRFPTTQENLRMKYDVLTYAKNPNFDEYIFKVFKV